MFRQASESTNSEYLEQFKNVVEVLEQHGGEVGTDEIYLNFDDEYKALTARSKTDERKQEAKERCKQRFLAYAFIYKSDNDRYAKLKDKLHKNLPKLFRSGIQKYYVKRISKKNLCLYLQEI